MEGESSWDAPRRRLGESKDGDRELLPVRHPDGQWQRRAKAQKPAEKQVAQEGAHDGASEEEAASHRPDELRQAAEEVESAASRRSMIAQTSAQVLQAPHKHIGLVGQLLYSAKRDTSPAIQRLALLSVAALLRDLIPAYRIRLPTEKELKMQVSKDVAAMRDFETKLLAAYEQTVETLKAWLRSPLEAHRATAVRGMAALLDKAYDFNGREQLIGALIPAANSSHAETRADACAALVRLYNHDTQGDATLIAVREASNLLKHSSFNVQPALLATWLELKIDAAVATAVSEPSNKKAKKRKRELDPVARELAAAAGERGNIAAMQSRILEHVFVSYARVVKNGASSPLLPSVLRGVAKFAHSVNVELLLDLFANLRALLNTPGALSDASALQCVHALLQLLSGHGAALAVDAKDVQHRLYSLLAARSLLEQPQMLATALDCVEHLAKRNRTALLAPRAASIVRRLLGLASTSPPAMAIALICACSRLIVACPRIGTMLEPPEGGTPMLALLGGGGGAGEESADIDSPAAMHSTLWLLSELRRHYHPTVSSLASKLATRDPLPPRFLNATPLALMNSYSDANGAFHPAPTPPKPHRLAAAAAAAAKEGGDAPTLGAVGSSRMAVVREAETEAQKAAGNANGNGVPATQLPFARGRLR